MTNEFAYNGSDLRKIALNDFFSVFLKENVAVYYRAAFTEDAELSKYCSYVEQVSKANRKINKRLFFDVKINSFYDKNYLMDKDRFEYLYSLAEGELNTAAYYVIFTPKNTVVFNLTELWNTKKIKFEPSKKIQGNFVCVLRSYQATEVGYTIPTPGRSNPSKTNQHNHQQPVNQPKTREAFPADDHVTTVKPKFEMFKEEDDEISITSFDITPAKQAEDLRLGVKRDGSGQIVFESAAQFKLLPEHIQEEFRDRNIIFTNLKDKGERERLLKEQGSIKKLAKYVKDQLRNNMLNRK